MSVFAEFSQSHIILLLRLGVKLFVLLLGRRITLLRQDSGTAAPRRGCTETCDVLFLKGGDWLLPVRSTAERVRADWGHESCCIALHVPGFDPVVRANLGTSCYPFPAVRYGWLGRSAT